MTIQFRVISYRIILLGWGGGSLVPSPSFSRVGDACALRGEGKRRAWYTLYAHALQKSHESHYKIIT